jgi:hypothetical protein
MWRGRIDDQILCGALGKIAARVRQRLEQADRLRLHAAILQRQQRDSMVEERCF